MARLTRFPDEFEALLSPLGQRVLQGKDPRCGTLAREKFFSEVGLLREDALADCVELLSAAFSDLLVELTQALPSVNAVSQRHQERLHKVARMQTVPGSTGPVTESMQWKRAEACGLAAMLMSQSYRAFVAAIAGRAVEGPHGLQALCYRPGDYAGPHTDHQPENERMRGGYFDVHLTFCTPGVSQQLIVYERDGHLCEQRSIAESGLVTAYRLPFWHYTTPMQVTRPDARRWLVLGTFLDSLTGESTAPEGVLPAAT